MTFLGNVIRFIPKENKHMLPSHAVIHYHARPQGQVGLLKVEIPFKWIRRNTVMYQRLMGSV
jgi:hypothetical protein